MNNLGEKIRILRERKGYSQTEFAEVIGVSRQSISKWENGESTPDAYNLKSIANILNVSLDELLEVKFLHGFKPKDIHLKLNTLCIILYILSVSYFIFRLITFWHNSKGGLIIDGSGVSVTAYRISSAVLLLFVVLVFLPPVFMLLYRKGLKSSKVNLDNLLIYVILLTLCNFILGVIHIVSLVLLNKEKNANI